MLIELNKIFATSKIVAGENLQKHCTLGVGGTAKFFVEASSIFELSHGISFLSKNNIKFCIIGNGSNVIFSDDGFDGVVISTKKLNKISVYNNRIFCEAGVNLPFLFQTALKNSLKNAEFMSHIPATVGGAIVMNAGCYGGEISQVVERVYALREGKIIVFDKETLKFSHRKNNFLQQGDIVVAAIFRFEHGNFADIALLAKEQKQKRISCQPTGVKTAGSTFKRPENYYAGELIEKAGLKGYKSGGVMVSDKHAGFLVNFNNAKCKDVRNIIDYISKEVYNKFKVCLQLEIVFIE